MVFGPGPTNHKSITSEIEICLKRLPVVVTESMESVESIGSLHSMEPQLPIYGDQRPRCVHAIAPGNRPKNCRIK